MLLHLPARRLRQLPRRPVLARKPHPRRRVLQCAPRSVTIRTRRGVSGRCGRDARPATGAGNEDMGKWETGNEEGRERTGTGKGLAPTYVPGGSFPARRRAVRPPATATAPLRAARARPTRRRPRRTPRPAPRPPPPRAPPGAPSARSRSAPGTGSARAFSCLSPETSVDCAEAHYLGTRYSPLPRE